MSQKIIKELVLGIICREELQTPVLTAGKLATRINHLFRHSLLPINAIGASKPVDFVELIDKSSILILEKEENLEKTVFLLKDILENDSSKKVMVMGDTFKGSEKGILMSSGARFLLTKPISDDLLKRSIETCITAIEIQWWSLGGSPEEI